MKKRFIFMAASLSCILTACGGLLGLPEGGETLDISLDEAQQKLSNYGTKTGYEIKFNYQDDSDKGSFTVGKKGNANWMISNEEDGGASGHATLQDDKGFHWFELDNSGEFEFCYTVQDVGEDYSSLISISYTPWLYFGHTYDGLLNKKGLKTVAGRSGTEYEFSMSNLGVLGALTGESLKWKVVIDNEFGFTLKLDAAVTEGGTADTLKYEVTSFKSGNSVNTPRLVVTENGGMNGGDDDDPTGGTADNNNSRYTEELKVNSASELYCINNERFVAKYVGNAEQYEEHDSLFVDDYGQNSIYFVWTGFNSDGSLNRISGHCCLYYFYNDATSYSKGKEDAKRSIRGINDEKKYFTYLALNVDAESWDELVKNFANGDEYYYPNFQMISK